MPYNDDSENNILNPTDTPSLSELMLKRRSLLVGGFATAAVAFFGSGTGTVAASAASGSATSVAARTRLSSGFGGPSLGFSSIPPSAADGMVVPNGYTAKAILAWGEPLMSSGPEFKEDASNSSDDQLVQMGMGHDGMQYLPLEDENNNGILVINHEYTNDNLLFTDGDANWTQEKTLKEQAAHGVALVEVRKNDAGDWERIDSPFNRRITPNTPMKMTGPAAGHRLVQTADDPEGTNPIGTVNNCGSGMTPWGTVLVAEENFNGYFWEETEGAAEGISDEQAQMNSRYGVGGQGFGYQWATTDERWRADLNPQEPNRFGWMVEVDPMDPTSTPVKRTALGRFKHEGAACTTSKTGRAVVYMGDDQRFDYFYKFVSKYPWQYMLDQGMSPLDEGTLYVAVFNGDGTGQWQALEAGRGPLTSDKGFADQGDICVKTRMAADLYGATPMDRPEWATVHPDRPYEGFVVLTNNTRRDRGNPANPRVDNQWGHIIRWDETANDTGRDPEATTFRWEFFVLAGPGDGVDGSTTTTSDSFGSPDGLWMDDNARLWIQTDGRQPGEANNQMLCANTETSEIKRFFTGPNDCEVTGIAQTPDGSTMFINIQHPGDSGTPEDPSATSSFPYGGRPRPATVVIQKSDGGVVGT